MVVLLASDVHESYELLKARLMDSRIEACICGGDVSEGFPNDPSHCRLPKPVYTVYGNNERWGYLRNKVPNLVWMEAGKIYNVKGLSVAGMGGEKARNPQRPGHFSEGEVKASLALRSGSVDIFVTHHPPRLYADLCVNKHRKHCGSAEVAEIMAKIRPRLLLSGHLHWQQFDIYGTGGNIDTYVVTLGRFPLGDYGLLSERKITLYKKGVRYCELYWQNRSR